jgi:hypothetical protein
MLNYIVLFRTEALTALDAPLGFQCYADTLEHAEEQCENAYPACDIVWVWQGPEGVGIQPALNDYYNTGLND